MCDADRVLFNAFDTPCLDIARRANGVINVSILGRDDLLVESINLETLNLSGMTVASRGNGRFHANYRDINRDSIEDIVLRFQLDEQIPRWIVNNTLYMEGLIDSGETIVGRIPLRSLQPNTELISSTELDGFTQIDASCSVAHWNQNEIKWIDEKYTKLTPLTIVYRIPKSMLSNDILDLNNDGANDTVQDALLYNRDTLTKVFLQEAVASTINSLDLKTEVSIEWYEVAFLVWDGLSRNNTVSNLDEILASNIDLC